MITTEKSQLHHHWVHTLESISQLHDIIDLDKVIVISGFGEVGPWGSSHVWWKMEAKGYLTLKGCIKMAWMMGYIKPFDGCLKEGTLHMGWVDMKTGDPVNDKNICGKYKKAILSHTGIQIFGELILVPALSHLMLSIRA